MAEAGVRAVRNQEFSKLLARPVRYLPLSKTQQHHGDGEDDVGCARTLVWRVARSVFQSTRGTFGGVAAHDEASANTSVFLLLIEICKRTSVDWYIMTLYNERLVGDEKDGDVVAYVLVVPLPHDDLVTFACNMQAHLTGRPLDVEPEAPSEDAPKPRGRPPKKKRKPSTQEKPSAPHRASWRNVTSEAMLLATLRKRSLGDRENECFGLDWDAVLGDVGGDDPSGTSLFSVFDAVDHFSDSANQAWYKHRGVPDVMCDPATYFNDGAFDPPSAVYDHYPWALRRFCASDRCVAPDADTLLEYMLPNNDPTLDLLREQLSEVMRFQGADSSERLEYCSDEEMMAMFTGRDAPLANYARSVDVTTANPLTELPSEEFSDKWKGIMYPVMYEIELMNKRRKRSLCRRLAAKLADDRDVSELHLRVVDSVNESLTAPAVGSLTYYQEVWKERSRLLRQMRSGSPVANTATALLHCQGDAAVFSVSDDLQGVCDLLTNHMNATPQQLRIVMKLVFAVYACAEHVFGPVYALALFGDSDVGKSYAMKIVSACLPNEMQEQSNDASDKAWALMDKPFRFKWMDEVNIGLSDTSKSASKDSKIMQAQMQEGKTSYDQYQRGSDGSPDWLLKRNADCRKLYALTSNFNVTPAMESRMRMEHAYEPPYDPNTKSKINAAICSSNVYRKAAALAMQARVAGSAYLWNAYAIGAFVTDGPDFRMLEIFVAMYNKVLVPVGFAQLKCRDVDRLKHSAKGIMNMWCSDELYTHAPNAEIARDKARELAWFLVRGSVIPMRAVEIAFNMNQECRAFARTETRALIGIKCCVTHTPQDRPVSDTTGTYYATRVGKRGAAKEVSQSARLSGHVTADDVIQAALTKLEVSKIDGMPIIKYESVNYSDMLFVLKSAVDASSVLTDHEAALVEWVQRAVVDDAMCDLGFVRFDQHEEHYLIKREVVDCINGTATLQITQNVPDIVKELDAIGAGVYRLRALAGLGLAMHDDPATGVKEPVATVHTDLANMFYGLNFMDDANDPRYHVAAPCKAGGRHDGRRACRYIMAGSLRVSCKFIETFKRGEEMAKSNDAALSAFRDQAASVSGESRPGDVCFRGVSSIINYERGSSDTSVCNAVDPGWTLTYTNPRTLAAMDQLDHASYFKYDSVHPENQNTITVRANMNLYEKCVRENALINTGVDLDTWEAKYNLPPMFRD